MPYRVDRLPLAVPAMEELAATRVREGKAPATAWAVFGPEGVVAAGAESDPAVGPVPDAGTAFRVASCTKSFTAATLLTFVAEGALSLETPLTDVLDASVLGASRAPTLGELAAMAGGIPIDDPWADRQESMTTADFDALVADGVRLVSEPGTRYEYSSFAYAILGRVLERIGGRPYPRLVHERIIDPLGLAGLGYDRGVDATIAPGYARVEGRWVEQPWAEPGAFSALGGIIATPTALATWAGWLAAAWRDDGDAVLAADLRRAMQEPRTPVPGPAPTHYGLGLVVEEHERHGRVISHSGGYPGYGAHMRWHPASGIGVVVLENARYSGATLPATRALQVLLDGALDPEAEPVLWPETAAARDVVEGLLRSWDDGAVAAIAADNVELDETSALRRAHAERLRDRVALASDAPVLPLSDAGARSDSPAHLAWTVRGARGAIRCEIRMTPVREPKLQTLALQLG
ncbi:serine hydrolase domain-containing protein [Amnibacterium kyonggiense]|uniref:CubicO group peptidase (Beta-lactamase class C family) n=1 Tax=Amnibacterium kyonggiense TaxID=595671 RepID=A0A4R7FSD0_9MICO|nr:serine hydrolase domain-containing protein [Amnibacterium kyonggiense]TDS80743.1 CubicO group peptidase (beta-lactamase class C family) [Amnibacterium kyonggiense]